MASFALFTVYVALIVLFYDKTDGFQKTSLVTYSVLKSIPVFALSAMVYLGHGNFKNSRHALGLFFGACGDFLIAYHQSGLVSAAIAFGIGHLFYMGTFALEMKKVSAELAAIIVVYALFINHFFLMPQFYVFPLTTIVMMAYSVILGTALVISGSLHFHGTKTQEPKQVNNTMRFLGYFLFFLSDSMLLLGHAGVEIPFDSFLVLSTYYTSQYMILTSGVLTQQLIYSPLELEAKTK
jgi:uncharacterized membrane protein YhhN